jgi:cyclohexanone monooxygenase
LQPGWQQARMDNFNALVSGVPQEQDLVNDGWTDIIGNMLALMRKANEAGAQQDLATTMQLADFKKMESIRARAEQTVRDKRTAEALKPYYNQFCKRPCFHDEYLQTYNRPNVALVDTNGKGVERLTERGVVANGKEYEVDCLIFATGFEVGTSYTRRAGYDIIGRGGKTLSEHWSNGLRTLHGLTTHGFPNCFFLGFTQTAITISVPQALNEQAKHVAYMVTQSRARGGKALEATAEGEDAYVNEVRSLARIGERFYRECTPGYYNSEGMVGNKSGFFSDMYGAGPLRFFEVLDQWRSDGRMLGLEVR